MTKLELAARKALEALEVYGEHAEDCPQYPTYTRPQDYPKCDCGFDQAIAALREALAEQAEQGPVKRFTSDDVKVAFENGYAAAISVSGIAKEAEQKPVAYTNKEQLGYLKDPRYQAAPMAMWSKPFDKRINVSLYAAPVRTKDLTVSELDAIIEKHYDDEMDLKAMILDGIAAYKEKNK